MDENHPVIVIVGIIILVLMNPISMAASHVALIFVGLQTFSGSIDVAGESDSRRRAKKAGLFALIGLVVLQWLFWTQGGGII